MPRKYTPVSYARLSNPEFEYGTDKKPIAPNLIKIHDDLIDLVLDDITQRKMPFPFKKIMKVLKDQSKTVLKDLSQKRNKRIEEFTIVCPQKVLKTQRRQEKEKEKGSPPTSPYHPGDEHYYEFAGITFIQAAVQFPFLTAISYIKIKCSITMYFNICLYTILFAYVTQILTDAVEAQRS